MKLIIWLAHNIDHNFETGNKFYEDYCEKRDHSSLYGECGKNVAWRNYKIWLSKWKIETFNFYPNLSTPVPEVFFF